MYLKKRMNAVITACILMTGAFVASCSNDDAAPDGGVVAQGDPVNVTVTINQTSTTTRNSSSTKTATSEETTVTGNLVVFVFDATPGTSELLESTHTVAIDPTVVIPGNKHVSKTFAITTGDKYFYVFANADKALDGRKGTYIDGSTYLRSLAPPGCTHAYFKTNTLTKLRIEELSKDYEFLIGTLWEGKDGYAVNRRTVTLPTPPAAYVEIKDLQVGRLVSKVSFPDANFKAQFTAATTAGGSKFAGVWEEVEWRIVNQPDEMYLIGNWESFVPGNAGSQVITPFFESDYLFWKDNGKFTDDKYRTEWAAVRSLYTFENTHGKKLDSSISGENYPRKGNTTAVQFKCKFVPYPVYNSSGAQSVLEPSGDFWAVKNPDDTYKIYKEDPSPSVMDAVHYEGGLVYYHAYITDTNESRENKGSTKYAVLRNHQYDLTIASISKLGDNDENPFNEPDGEPGNTDPDPNDPKKPEDPIETDTPNIIIQIEVLDWNLIEQTVEW